MRRVLSTHALMLALAAVAVTACDDDDDDDGPTTPTQTGLVRVLHVASGAPNVDVLVDDVAEPQGQGLEFASTSSYFEVDAGSRTIEVVESGTTTPPLGSVTQTVQPDAAYTVVAVGGAEDLELVLFEDDNTAPASGQFKVRAVHAIPELGDVDVFITAPDADITTATPTFDDLAYAGDLVGDTDPGYVTLAAGSYRVRVTAPDDPANVLFDSGETGQQVPAGGVFTAVAVVDPTTGEPDFLLSDDLSDLPAGQQ